MDFDDLSEDERTVLAELARRPHTQTSLAAALRQPEVALLGVLAGLEGAGLITRPSAFYGTAPRSGADVQPRLTPEGQRLAGQLRGLS